MAWISTERGANPRLIAPQMRDTVSEVVVQMGLAMYALGTAEEVYTHLLRARLPERRGILHRIISRPNDEPRDGANPPGCVVLLYVMTDGRIGANVHLLSAPIPTPPEWLSSE